MKLRGYLLLCVCIKAMEGPLYIFGGFFAAEGLAYGIRWGWHILKGML